MTGCQKKEGVLEMFPVPKQLTQLTGYDICKDSLGVVEGLACNGKDLLVYDTYSGKCYTTFDIGTEKYIAHFGTVGQGPTEILPGSYGHLAGQYFSVYNDQVKYIINYDMDALRNGHADGAPVRLTTYDVPDLSLSRLALLNDSIYLAAGVYQSHYQYVLFDKHNRVLDSGVDIYNASDEAYDASTKFLSNQGDLVKHPQENKFAYSLNFSSNMDFIEIKEGKINPIRELRLGNPELRPASGEIGGNTFFTTEHEENSIFGYINLSATSHYVYALFSDKSVRKSRRQSKNVLVFDWQGNPVEHYALDVEAYYIAVDEVSGKIFAAFMNDIGEWDIACYRLPDSL